MTYPPSQAECAIMYDELKRLDASGTVEVDNRKYTIIHDLAEGHYFEARQYFTAGLNHLDPHYRYACISALGTHWQDKDSAFIGKLLDMAESDKDGFVRLISAHILGWFRVPAALPILKRIVEMEAEDPTVRQIAYDAILAILG